MKVDRTLLSLGVALGIVLVAAGLLGLAVGGLLGPCMILGAIAQALCSAVLLRLRERNAWVDDVDSDWPSMADVAGYEYGDAGKPARPAPPPAPDVVVKIDAVERAVAAHHGDWPFPVRQAVPPAPKPVELLHDGYDWKPGRDFT